MFSCVWLHFKKFFEKYFLMFGCVLENIIENTFSTCCLHFLTFSRLPNEYIMSFIPKNTNKTQKRSHFLGEITIAISPISIVRSRSQSRRFRWSRSARSRSTPIGAVPVITIVIVVRRCGSFRLARCVGRSSQALREAVCVWERSACEREEENVWSENMGWNWFPSLLA